MQLDKRQARYQGRTDRDRLIEGEAMLRDRTMGLTLVQLMDKYGYSKPTVIKRLDTAIKARIPETVDAYRAQINEAIDLAMSRLGRMVEMGEQIIEHGRATKDVAMMERGQTMIANALKTMSGYLDRRAKLNGTDAPLKTEATIHQVTREDLEMEEMIREAKAKVAHESAGA
jgi:hypothetical protein